MNELINSCVTAINDIGRIFSNFAGSMFIQSSVLIVLLLIIDFLIRKRVRATFRYWIWMLVFIKLVLPPTLSSPTGIGNWIGDYFSADSIVAEQPANPIRNEPVAATELREFTEPVVVPQNRPAPAFSQPLAPAASNPATTIATGAISAAPELNPLTWQGICFLLWFVGVLVITVLLIQRIFFVKGLIAQSKPAKNRLADILDNCREQVGIRRNIRLRLSHNVTSPAVCGLFHPVILIPKTLLEQLSHEKLRAVLIHELAHIKRGDLWINCVQTFLQIAYFYNPFVWLANLIVRRIREQAVDEMVLVALGAAAKSYSNTLIDIAEMAFSRPALSLRLVGVVESKKALSNRIKHILSRPIPKTTKLGLAGLLAILLTAVVLLPMAKGQMGRSHDAAAVGSGSDMYSILLLDNTDSEYEGKDRYDDRLYILDRKGNIKGAVSGLNICETAGGAHMLAVDEKRRTLWVAENVGSRLWHFDLTTGELLQRIPDLKASALAIDPTTGNVWVVISEGGIGKGHVRVISPVGEKQAEYSIAGFDITYSRYDDCFWIVGKNIYKLDRQGNTLSQITDEIPFMAVSVSVDQKTGNAWIVVKAHINVPESKPEVWVIDRNMEVKHRMDLGELIPFCVSVDSDNAVAWVGCLSTTLRFTTGGEKLHSARQISGFSVVPGSSRDSVVAASQFELIMANVKESGYVGAGLMSKAIQDELGSSQKWLAVVPFADARLKSSQELAYLTEYKSWEQKLTEYPESVEKLKSLGKAMFMYANDYDDKFPGTLQDAQGFVGSVELKWLIENVEYRGKGKTTSDPPDIAVAYDKTVLEKGEGTLVLYADSHVAYESPKTLVKIGIRPDLKTNVQIEVADKIDIAKLAVKGIIQNKNNRYAVIGTQLVQEGDEIFGATVVTINFNNVVFEKDGQKWTQEVEQPNSLRVPSDEGKNVYVQGMAKIILKANVFSVNAPLSLITNYLRDKLGINNINAVLTETQAAQFKKWMASIPNTTMISSPSAIVIDGQQADLSVTSQNEYTIDYEKTSDSPPQYKPKRQKFTTGVELFFIPELKKEDNLIVLTVNLKQRDLDKIESKSHESGNRIQFPVINMSEIHTQVAVPLGKYFLVSAAGMYSAENGSKPDQPVKQTILLVKADVQTEVREKETTNTKTILLQDVDSSGMMLDLASGELLEIPKADTEEEIWEAIEKFGKGDLVYDASSLILVRGATTQSPTETITGPFKACRIGQKLPVSLTITTKENADYAIKVHSADNDGCQLEYYPLQKTSVQAETELLKQIGTDMIQASNAGDIDRLLSHFTDDAIALPDQHEAAIGKGSLRNLYLENKKENTKINSINNIEQKLWICGDMIFETGWAVISFTRPTTRFQLSDWRNYVTLWSRQPDGSLKAKLEASNPALIPGDGNIPEPSRSVVINFTSGTEPSDDNMEAVYGQIRQYESTFHKAFVEHNTEAAVGFYADNAILMPWGKNAVKGKKEITEHIGKDMSESSLVDMTQNVLHIEGNNRMLYAVNLFTWTFKDASSGQDITLTGKGVHVWSRQQDGSWKILIDLHNLSAPIGGD